ncbi:MAG: hypothetical protein AB4372_19290 [Xenococcus sp. (in: cyanobacteria)]
MSQITDDQAKPGTGVITGRGGYLTDDGICINSDCLGAANLLRKKAITQLENVSLAKVTR